MRVKEEGECFAASIRLFASTVVDQRITGSFGGNRDGKQGLTSPLNPLTFHGSSGELLVLPLT